MPELTESDLDALLAVLGFTVDTQLHQVLLNRLEATLKQLFPCSLGLSRLASFLERTRSPESFLVFLSRDPDALATLLSILCIDSPAVQWLLEDPDCFDWLRMTSGLPIGRSQLIDVLLSELRLVDDEAQALLTAKRFRSRESLRVICAHTLQGMTLASACQQLAWIADANVEGMLHFARSERKIRGTARDQEAGTKIAAVGLGALGGEELDLLGAIELMFVADLGLSRNEQELAASMESVNRVVHRAIQLLEDRRGPQYRVLSPMQRNDPSENEIQLVHEPSRWIQNLESQGRTWQRLAMVKARHVAGNRDSSTALISNCPSLVFRRYLSRADIAGIGAFKRKLGRQTRNLTASISTSIWNLELLQRWHQEIVFLVQFLQLINGGELESVRGASTRDAIDALARSNCLTEREQSILQSAYELIGRTLFAFQMLLVNNGFSGSDADGSKFPPIDEMVRRIALTLGYKNSPGNSAGDQLRRDLADVWQRVRQVNDHLRGEVFIDESAASDETDLILDPSPDPEWIRSVLSKFHFTDYDLAYRNLMELAREEVAMLSTRRCRHFLSTIAPSLLKKIGNTPAPDRTLANLAVSCRSLGGKGVLWELFSMHEPSMDLYVRLCGSSPYLIGILTSNPGMIDELMDSLMLNRLPSGHQLSVMIHELCRGADDIDPIVQSFKNTMHLNVGVRDILGKDSISATHRALSDIAEVCLQQVIDAQYNKLVKRFGIPMKASGEACCFGVVATGKLGCREPNYHSDMALLFVFDEDGLTRPLGATRHHDQISAEYFFHQLAQKVSQSVNRVTRSGRLYEMKNWVLDQQRDSVLAWRTEELSKYFVENQNTGLQRQQLCTARTIVGDPEFQISLTNLIHAILTTVPWTSADRQTVLDHRRELESTAGPMNLKRGIGGTLDVEFLTQLLTLENMHSQSNLLVSGTIETIDRLGVAGLLPSSEVRQLKESYNFLRSVESGLRLMNTSARHDLPESSIDLERLAYILRLENGKQLQESCQQYRELNRHLFLQYFGAMYQPVLA